MIHHRLSTSLFINRVKRGWASLAVLIISATSAGCRESGKHSSVTIDTPKTLRSMCLATITSGTVDIPTTSPPMSLRNRYSARVSRVGPATATRKLTRASACLPSLPSRDRGPPVRRRREPGRRRGEPTRRRGASRWEAPRVTTNGWASYIMPPMPPMPPMPAAAAAPAFSSSG